MSRAKYIFRMDDICPTMKWANFERLMDVFIPHGVVPLLGIIPENQDESLKVDPERSDFWTLMKTYCDQKLIEVAQHGTYHVYMSNRAGTLAREFGFPDYSEFAGLDYATQLEKLKIGKEKLIGRGIDTDIFMAPAHSYDEVTVRALADAGFAAVTDGVARYPYLDQGLIFVPQIHWQPTKLSNGVSTICLHSNTMGEQQMQRVEKFVKENNKDIIRFSDALNDVRPYSNGFAYYWKLKFSLFDKTLLPFAASVRNKLLSR
jgi:predicted deacetylase